MVTTKRKKYLRKYQREWVRKRRAEFFKDKSCEDCGSTERLELDHIWPDQKINHTIWAWSKERREEEIAKCQVLCKKCHWDKTCIQNSWRKHGNLGTYRNGCRCDLCIEANREKLRRWPKKKKAGVCVSSKTN